VIANRTAKSTANKEGPTQVDYGDQGLDQEPRISLPAPVQESHKDRLLTDKEAPEIVGVKRKTLQEWRRLGIGPKFLRVSNRIFYRYADLIAFLTTCPHTVATRSRRQLLGKHTPSKERQRSE
jgi:hypothetical protein